MFQTRMNNDLPIGVKGDFASVNPNASQFAGEGGLVAGPGGVIVGNFAWVMDDGETVTSFAQGPREPDMFIHREGQALNTEWLQEYGMLIPEGFAVTGMRAGDFLVEIDGATAVSARGTVYASYADGSVQGSLPAGDTATGSMGATFTATGAEVGGVHQLTTSLVTGLISVGETVSGTGIVAGTQILSQISGTPGGAGVYAISQPSTSNAQAGVTSFGNTLNVTAAVGTLNEGQPVAGTGIPANAVIESQVSGTPGGVGVYLLNYPATAYAASTALTLAGGIATTKWKFLRANAAGETGAIGTW